MKNVFFLFALSFYSTFLFAQKSDSLVSFSQKIDWSLFKNSPESDTFGAQISTSIHLEVAKENIWNGTISFKSHAIMYPYKSWVKPGYADLYTLQHEQTHFNLTEICARRLQNELNLMKIKSGKSAMIETIFAKWQKKMEDLQRQYDLETKGGNDSAAQKTWNQNVLADLKSTSLNQ